MSSIFSPCSGAVVVPRPWCPATETVTVQLAGVEIPALISGMTLEMSGNYQFLHSLNELVYFYAFGDRVGTLVLNGLGFLVACGGRGSKLPEFDGLYSFYMKNRAAASGNKAMQIVLTNSGKSIQLWGFLTGMRIDVTDSQMGVIGYWTMRFEVLPQK